MSQVRILSSRRGETRERVGRQRGRLPFLLGQGVTVRTTSTWGLSSAAERPVETRKAGVSESPGPTSEAYDSLSQVGRLFNSVGEGRSAERP
jgi:hypothetical protein